MIGFHIHVNAITLEYITAHNIGFTDLQEGDDGDLCYYKVKGMGKTFTVKHKRSQGWKKLLQLILKKLPADRYEEDK